MKRSSFKSNFIPPKIFGALMPDSDKIPSHLSIAFAKKGTKYAFLSFVTKKAHLKNTAQCMKAMDILGLWVSTQFSADIAKFISLSPSAKSSGIVDAIVRRKRSFTGRCVKLEVLAELLSAMQLPQDARTAKLLGSGLDAKIAKAALLSTGFKLSRSKAAAVTLNVKGGTGILSRGRSILSKAQFSSIYYRRTVEVLTQSSILTTY